jgi:peptidoglycan/LPS O-acetylase OafA/YrhL
MDNKLSIPASADQTSLIPAKKAAGALDIGSDLTWVDMLKGIAIIGVFSENCMGYMEIAPAPALAHKLADIVTLAGGSFVHVFFVLSGFGLMLAYLRRSKAGWSWLGWARRRITKIVVPYEIAVILTFLMGILGSYLYSKVDTQFSWGSLLAYMTFTRNFYPLSWIWNPPMWFMPIIIGLYLCFPILVRIFEKWGSRVLLLGSLLVTYGSLVAASLAGSPGGHGRDLFAFWLFQFSLGMVLAHTKETAPHRLRLMLGPIPFILGLGLTMFSWALRTYIPLGKVFNDSLTTVGIFLVLLNVGWVARAKIPVIGGALHALSRQSYLMFLIHFPIMLFLVGPLLATPVNPILAFGFLAAYILAIFWLCVFLSRPVDWLTSKLQRSGQPR